ncbi:MAG TPA: 2OG-Fe(II) oxygenase [Stellaceae bacterium]|nr:2OG-Fe(II) oxygenase [Stellaceae bacterium]
MQGMGLIDLARLRDVPLTREPFDFIIVEDFLDRASLPALVDAFPAIADHGSYPLPAVSCDPIFARLAQELEGGEMRAAIAEKFAIDLDGRPTMITLRGYSDGKDGGIHTDSATKLITVLIYMNPGWHEAGGRLRLLRGPDDLSDYVAEVPPLAGTMVAFRRSSTSFHGHHAHIGPRRSIQLNWVTEPRVVRRELSRHRWSARLKALNPLRRHGDWQSPRGLVTSRRSLRTVSAR